MIQRIEAPDPLQALFSTEARFKQAASFVANSTASAGTIIDSVDLSTQAVTLLQSRNSFAAVTDLVRIEQEMNLLPLNAVG